MSKETSSDPFVKLPEELLLPRITKTESSPQQLCVQLCAANQATFDASLMYYLGRRFQENGPGHP